MSTFLAFLLALASSFTTAEAPARAHARQKTRGTLTEVHFFKADDHTRAIAKYSITAPVVGSTIAHGSYARLRMGPRDLAKAERIRAGIGDARVLRAGDEVTVFAINHATGYAGMKTVTVPDYADADARITDLVEIVGDIRLFPPEIEVAVDRQLTSQGVKSTLPPSKVRQGGLATRQDDWLSIATRWRVRLAPPVEDDLVDGGLRGPLDPRVDAGVLTTEVRTDAGEPTALLDEGAVGGLLERSCAELGEDASRREQLECLNDERTLTAVPEGVPPLTARLVHLSGAASTDKLFLISGGTALTPQVFHAARRLESGSQLQVTEGVHLLHVVGRQMQFADADNDGELSAAEAIVGTACREVEGGVACSAPIQPSNAVLPLGAPDFRDDPQMRGFPKQAIAVKALYDANLRDAAKGARRVQAYDRVREHRFRVASLIGNGVRAGADEFSTRKLSDEKDPQADDKDAFIGLSLFLNDIGQGERAGARSDFEVRLGTDGSGVECDWHIDRESQAVTADCDSEYLPEIISANDIVYVELFERSNSANVLYRFNFYGVSTRIDHASATTTQTLERAVPDDRSQYVRLNRAPHSKLNNATFAISEHLFTGNTAALELRAGDTLVRRMNVTRTNGEMTIVGDPTDGWQAPIVLTKRQAVGTRYANMNLPAWVTSMLARVNAPSLSLSARSPTGTTTIAMGRATGRIESRAARPPGHRIFNDVDMIDGRLSFSDVDIDLPERGARVQFVRTYNNQNNEVGSLGVGFTHNHEAFIVEETRRVEAAGVIGRYSVVVGGQQLTFPECQHNINCASDRSMDATLTVTDSAVGALRATLEDHGSGRKLTFERAARSGASELKDKTWLSSVDDGLKGKIVYTYSGSNELSSVAREDGLLRLEFAYESLDVSPLTHAKLREQIEVFGLKRLASVTVKRSDVEVEKVVFSHDTGGTTCASSLSREPQQMKLNLLLAVCRPLRAPTPEWHFVYERIPSDVTLPTKQLVLSNELKSRELHVDGGALHSAWKYTHATGDEFKVVPHLTHEEVVVAVQPPGADAALRIEAPKTFERIVTRADAVKHEFVVNTYGTVVSELLAGREYKSTNEHDNEGKKIVEAKRVLPTKTKGPRGESSVAHETTRHRTLASEFQPSSTSPLLAKLGLLGLRVETPTHDERFGVPTSMRFPGADGETAAASVEVGAGGAIDALTVGEGEAATSVEMAHDEHGLPTTGHDVAGNTVAWSGSDAAFGQRTTEFIEHRATELGLERLHRTHSYDDLGRLTSTIEEETGRGARWKLDALGRETERTEFGGPSPSVTTTTSYSTAGGVTTTTIAVGGVERTKMVTDANQRTTRVETKFGGGSTETTTYTYVSNVLKKAESLRSKTVWTHNARNQVMTETETRGGATRKLEHTRDEDGNLLSSKVTDPSGAVVVTSYDNLGRAVKVDYGESGQATNEGTAPRDDVFTTLDAQGNVVEERAGKHTWVMSYDKLGRLLRRMSKDGDEGEKVVDENFTSYDKAGRLLGKSNATMDASETYEYDDVLGRLTKTVRSVKTVDITSADADMVTTETRAYSDAQDERTVTVTTTTTFNTGGSASPTRIKHVVLTLDAMDRTVKVSADPPEGDTKLVTLIAYDDKGMTTTTTSPSLLVTTDKLDEQGSLLERDNGDQKVTQLVDAAGVVRTRTTNGPNTDVVVTITELFDAFGRPTSRTLAGTPTTTTTWSYPGNGVVVETPPAGAPIKTTVNGRGLALRIEQGPVTTTMSYDGEWVTNRTVTQGDSKTTTTFTYDDAGRPLSEHEVWELGGLKHDYTTTSVWAKRTATVTKSWKVGGSTDSRTATMVVDSLGRVVSRKQGSVYELNIVDEQGVPVVSGATNALLVYTTAVEGLVTQVTQGSETTTTSYDETGRPFQVTDPLGTITTTTWRKTDVPKRRTVDQPVKVTELFNAAGHLTSRVVGDGDEPSEWTYAHGAAGELTSVVQPTGDRYTFGYAPDRKLTSLTPPGGVAQTWSYDDDLRRLTLRTRGTSEWTNEWQPDGSLKETTPLGHTITSTIDGRGRTVLRELEGAPGLSSVATVFDIDDLPLKVTDEGTDTGRVITTYTYDSRARLTKIARPGIASVGYRHVDKDSSLEVEHFIAGSKTQTKHFDGFGRLDFVDDSSANVDLDYFAGGLLKSISGQGFEEQRTYTNQLLTGINIEAGATNVTLAYTYDDRGNRLTESTNGDVTRYRYDAADRLIGVRYPDATAELYELRGDGARLARKRFDNYPTTLKDFDESANGAILTAHHAWEFDDADGLKRIVDVINTTRMPIVTDAAGRVTSSGTRINVWDVADRLRTTTDAGVTTSYTYDANNMRLKSASGATTQHYVWGAGGLEAEGTSIAALEPSISGAGLSLAAGNERFGHDALGSVVVRAPASGTTTRTAYDAWGAVRATPSTGPPLGVGANRVGFTGHANEPTGLVYAQQRWLDPSTARFLSLDPVAGSLSDPLSTQGYTYAHANPTRFTDPDGRCVNGAPCTKKAELELYVRCEQFSDDASRANRCKDSMGRAVAAARDAEKDTTRGWLGNAWDATFGSRGSDEVERDGGKAFRGGVEGLRGDRQFGAGSDQLQELEEGGGSARDFDGTDDVLERQGGKAARAGYEWAKDAAIGGAVKVAVAGFGWKLHSLAPADELAMLESDALKAGLTSERRAFVETLEVTKTPLGKASGRYEASKVGQMNYRVRLKSGRTIDADGFDGDAIVDAKFVSTPERSPFIPGSAAPDFIKDSVEKQLRDEFGRMKELTEDASIPFNRAIIRTNNEDAAKYFRQLMDEVGLNGVVEVTP